MITKRKRFCDDIEGVGEASQNFYEHQYYFGSVATGGLNM